MRLRRFCAEQGYALPLVLMAIALILLYSAETSRRVTREVRVTKVKEEAEFAFYAAEAGFNRVRARMIKQASAEQIRALHDRIDTLTYVDDEGAVRVAGRYHLQVEEMTAGVKYRVISTGTAGSDPKTQARRVVAGTIEITGTKAGGDKRVTTVYSP